MYGDSFIKHDETPPVVAIKELECRAFLLDIDNVRVRLLYPVYQDKHGSWFYVIRNGEEANGLYEAQVRWFWLWDLVGKERKDYEW